MRPSVLQLFSLSALSLVILFGLVACSSQKPSSFAGKWKVETTSAESAMLGLTKKAVKTTVVLDLPAKGDATCQLFANDELTSESKGAWRKVDDMLVITKANGGFIAWRISEKKDGQMTLLTDAGTILQMTRMP